MTSSRRRWSLVVACLALASCKGQPAQAPEASVHPEVQIARRCEELGDPPASFAASRARVFVELSHVAGAELPSPPGPWLAEHPVAVRSVSNFLVTPERPTSMPWGECLDAGCNTRAQSWGLSVRLPEGGGNVELSMQLRQGSGAPSSDDSPPLIDRTLALVSQQPVIVPDAQAAVGDDTLVATAYVLVRSDDFFRLLRCKAAQVGTDEIRPLQTAATPVHER